MNTWESGEQQHRFVGRLGSIEDALKAALIELPNDQRHAFDLLVVARDATHKAFMLIWGRAPECAPSASGEEVR